MISVNLFKAYIFTSLKKHTEYKFAFWTFIFGQILQVALWVVFWSVLLNNIGTFGSYTFSMMILLTGFVSFHNGIWFFFIHIWGLPRIILRGEFNTYLTRPVHPLIHFFGRNLNLNNFTQIILGIGLIVYSLVWLDIPFQVNTLVIAFIIAGLSFFATLLPFMTLCLSAFWIGKAEFLRDLYSELFVFENYPLTEFPRVFTIAFTYVIPLIFAGAIPVLVLTQLSLVQSLLMLGLLLLVVIGQLLLFLFIWKKGLMRYESYGG